MRLRQVLVALSAASTVVLVTSVAPASAGDVYQPVTSFGYYCDPEGYIDIAVSPQNDKSYDLHIGDEEFTDVGDGTQTGGPFADGLVLVQLFDVDQSVVFELDILVACDEPGVDVKVVCDDEGMGHLLVNIADLEQFDYDVYVDGTQWGAESITDTDLYYLDLGEYPEGSHTVSVDWLDDETEDFFFEETVTVDCNDDDSGSGAGIPTVGSDTAPLMVVGGLLMVVGAGLLVGRRLRTA